MKSGEMAAVVSGKATVPASGAVVIAFPGTGRRIAPSAVWRFSIRDRIVALDWERHSQSLGYTRVVFEAPEADFDGDAGEFLLVYAHGTSWAAWGVGCGPDGLTLWHAARGTTIGLFDTMKAALAQIHAAPVRRPA